MQNVGAYGQEVAETLVSVSVIDRRTLDERHFGHDACRFGYRTSRFKGDDRDAFVITGVTYRLPRRARPAIRYRELGSELERAVDLDRLEPGRAVSRAVRDVVLALRRRKSMIVDPDDPDSRSAGSFFLNPILDREALAALERRSSESTPDALPVPVFEEESGFKVPAAWLVERAGFAKGLRRGGVGLSSHHALALVSYGGGAGELLALAAEIAEAVERRFGVRLVREPVVLGAAPGVEANL
jgi:UDP-N-acetylmuramate dehydrogenase